MEQQNRGIAAVAAADVEQQNQLNSMAVAADEEQQIQVAAAEDTSRTQASILAGVRERFTSGLSSGKRAFAFYTAATVIVSAPNVGIRKLCKTLADELPLAFERQFGGGQWQCIVWGGDSICKGRHICSSTYVEFDVGDEKKFTVLLFHN